MGTGSGGKSPVDQMTETTSQSQLSKKVLKLVRSYLEAGCDANRRCGPAHPVVWEGPG